MNLEKYNEYYYKQLNNMFDEFITENIGNYMFSVQNIINSLAGYLDKFKTQEYPLIRFTYIIEPSEKSDNRWIIKLYDYSRYSMLRLFKFEMIFYINEGYIDINRIE